MTIAVNHRATFKFKLLLAQGECWEPSFLIMILIILLIPGSGGTD